MKLYDNDQAKKISDRKQRIEEAVYNRKAVARHRIEELQFQKELRQLEDMEEEWINE